jgi:hypothetical protein
MRLFIKWQSTRKKLKTQKLKTKTKNTKTKNTKAKNTKAKNTKTKNTINGHAGNINFRLFKLLKMSATCLIFCQVLCPASRFCELSNRIPYFCLLKQRNRGLNRTGSTL